MSLQLRFRLAQVILLAVFLAVGLWITVQAPFAEGPDEVAHFYFTRFIAKYGRLPLTDEERAAAGYKSDWPPLFHGLVGLAGRGIDLDSPPFVKVAQNNPRLQLVVGHKNLISWRALTTEDPYQGEVLLWYLGRWITLLCGAVGAGGVYFLGRTVYPANPWLALSATAILAFQPIYLLTSGVISYEPLLGALLAFYFLLLFYMIQEPAQNRIYVGLGFLMGLAILTKFTPVPALPVVPLLVIWFAYRRRWTWWAAIRRLSLFGAGVILTFGSWLLYAELYFNRIDELGWMQGLLSPFAEQSDETTQRILSTITGGALAGVNQSRQGATVLTWAWHIFSSAWGGGWLAWLFLGLWGLALIGLIRRWKGIDAQHRLWIFLLAAHVVLIAGLPLMRFLVTRQVATGMGQHLLFPAGAAMILLLVSGLRAWWDFPRLTWGLGAIAVVVFVYSIITIGQVAEPPWPIQTVPLSGNEEPIATFGDISLLDYKLTAAGQTVDLTLWWLLKKNFLNEDYWLELTLLDSNHQPRARWIGQPLNGRYPTRAWAPGDRIRDHLQLPVVGLPAGEYQVQLRWLGEAGPLLPTVSQKQTSPIITEGGLGLGNLSLSPPPALAADTVSLNGQEIGYTLWHQGQAAAGMPVFKEYATIIFSTDRDTNEIDASLIGPDGQPRLPLDHRGQVFTFNVEPRWASGEYRLRFEQRSGEAVVVSVETEPLLSIQTEERDFEVGAISQPLSANFAGQAALLGYDLPQRRVQAGDNFPVTLYWQALKTIGADLIIFNHLIDRQRNVWGGNDRRARDVYSTMLWAPDEIVTDSFNVQIDPEAPDGIYYLLVGLYLPVGEAPISLPLVQDGQFSEITSVSLGPVKIGRTPPGLTRSIAEPQIWLNHVFGDDSNLTLLGYDLTDQAGRNPLASPAELQSLIVTLYWRSEQPLPVDYTTFVHIRDEQGEIIAQKDQPPMNGAYPTSLWEPGEIIADEIVVSLPDELSPGNYQVVIGMYDWQNGRRLAVPGSPANEIVLTSVEIERQMAVTP